MTHTGTKTPFVLLLLSTILLVTESFDLDRDVIRRSILEYRTKRSLSRQNVHDVDSHRRLRRQAEFPNDDEDFSDPEPGSGATDYLTGNEPLPPDLLTTLVVPIIKQQVSEWVWYRCKVNFLHSITYTEELQDYTSEAFHSLSEKIMYAVEDYLQANMAGYHEATPLMFSTNAAKEVEVLIDVGSCSTNTFEEVEDVMQSLLRTGRISDLAVSDEGFTIRKVGTDASREECQPAPVVGSPTPEVVFTTEPTPPNVPDFDVGDRPTTDSGSNVEVVPPRRPFGCEENQATCTNGQCIDRSLICNGVRDCDDGSDEPASCSTGDSSKCDPTEFLCIGTGVCAQKLWKCDGDDDCGNGYDELNCPTARPGSICRGIEFECLSDALCVPASYQCDGEQDCTDGSDEQGCAAPTVTKPPRKLVEVQVGETVELECWASGVPSPIVSWRLNWGNVGLPPRVTMTSLEGKGRLIIKEARVSDQGAYTCEAINSQGSIFAVPDAVLVVEELPADKLTCPPGQYGNVGNCRPCYCFGLTDECEPSTKDYDEVNIEFSSPDDLGVVELRPAEVEGADPTPASEPINRNQIVVKPAARELQLIDLSKRFLAAAHYWSLPAQFLGAKINSYGGTLTFSFSYNNSYNFEPKPTNHSDVIIEGANGNVLVHHSENPHPEPVVKNQQNVSLTEDDWTTPEGEKATREGMLNVLNNVDKILLRTVYDNSMLSTGIGDIRMQVLNPSSSSRSGSTGVLASAVEECECPEGYTGSSCQFCATDYERILEGPFADECHFVGVEPTPAPVERICDTGFTGPDCKDCALGYFQVGSECLPALDNNCDFAGSYETLDGECDCKPGTEGEQCDQCQPGYFFLSESNTDGCLSCFCMGVARQCDSTTLKREAIVPHYREGGRFVLTNAASTRSLQDHIVITSINRHPTVRAHLGEMPRDVYYWTLPSDFTGNKISAYGGTFRYTITYDESDDAQPISRIADVKIFGNDIVLEHRSGVHPVPNLPAEFVVTLREDYWVKPDGSPATREHLMMALADIDSLLVRATYSSKMQNSLISKISLEIASSRGNGVQAMEVEECVCPSSHTGLSCEDCAPGYRRSGEGPFLGTCVKCSCNKHSEFCDQDTGRCIECQHHTEGDNCERCIPGFYGDPRLGTPVDCRPCPCPLLPALADREVVASCTVGIDGLPVCDQCPPGYQGRQCDECALGYAPDLRIAGSPCKKEGSDCQCDPHGSVDGTCDENGQCKCRENISGLKCDSCQRSYFYFSVENENGGCLPCFCMGVTRDCASSAYVRDKITADFTEDFGGFALTNRVQSQRFTNDLTLRSSDSVLTQSRMDLLPSDTYYWQLPEEFLGDKVVSYGGELRYTVSFTPGASGAVLRDHDVIIIGNDIKLVASLEGDVLPRRQLERSIYFRESFWRRPDGMPATREHLLMALADLDAILIRASYATSMVETTISRVSMDTSTENEFDGGEVAYDVEHCTCPDGYKGLSCEDCSPGYTRSGGGLYLGLCQPCRCHGQTESCDPETGVCIDCRGNTVGDYCEECAPGFYSMSTDPSQMDCQACACPGQGDNSFSETCEYVPESRNLICTACQEGYEGTRCENCAEGYEGNPRVSGGRCSKIGKPEGVDQAPPKVRVLPATLSVGEGDSATLRCLVESTGQVRVIWRRTGTSSSRPITSDAIILEQPYTLTIPRFSRSDAGTYECVAQNLGGVATDQAVVTLARNQPMIMVRVEEPTNRRLRVGSDVTFVCTATSKMPGYILSWSKKGSRLPYRRATEFNGILHITDLTEADTGSYVCTGSNMYEIDQAEAVLTVVRG